MKVVIPDLVSNSYFPAIAAAVMGCSYHGVRRRPPVRAHRSQSGNQGGHVRPQERQRPILPSRTSTSALTRRCVASSVARRPRRRSW